MRKLLLLFTVCSAAWAQDGSIVFDTLDRTIEADLGNFSCFFVGPIHDSIEISCWQDIDHLVLLRDAQLINVGTERTGNFDDKQITWVFRKTAPGVYFFEIHVGGKVLTGNLP